MIKVRAASRAVEDTSTVELEGNRVGLNGYCDRAGGDSSLESGRIVHGHVNVDCLIVEGGVCKDNKSLVVGAVLVLSGVGVRGLVLDTILTGIDEGLAGIATLAAACPWDIIGVLGAVDDLLLRKVEECLVARSVGVNGISSLHGADRTESPA